MCEADIFRPLRGYEGLRLEVGRHGVVCHVEFATSYDAYEALQRLHLYAFDLSKLHDPANRLRMSYAALKSGRL